MIYAIVRNGGKQYRVEPGSVLRVERLEAKAGSTLELTDVIMVRNGDKIAIGAPTVAKAKVRAQVVDQGRGPKIEVVNFRRRKHSMRHIGHRQDYTELKILGIDS